MHGSTLEDNLALWNTKIPHDLTRQINGSDCGVHTCMNMEKVVLGKSQYHLSPPMTSQLSVQSR